MCTGKLIDTNNDIIKIALNDNANKDIVKLYNIGLKPTRQGFENVYFTGYDYTPDTLPKTRIGLDDITFSDDDLIKITNYVLKDLDFMIKPSTFDCLLYSHWCSNLCDHLLFEMYKKFNINFSYWDELVSTSYFEYKIHYQPTELEGITRNALSISKNTLIITSDSEWQPPLACAIEAIRSINVTSKIVLLTFNDIRECKNTLSVIRK